MFIKTDLGVLRVKDKNGLILESRRKTSQMKS